MLISRLISSALFIEHLQCSWPAPGAGDARRTPSRLSWGLHSLAVSLLDQGKSCSRSSTWKTQGSSRRLRARARTHRACASGSSALAAGAGSKLVLRRSLRNARALGRRLRRETRKLGPPALGPGACALQAPGLQA